MHDYENRFTFKLFFIILLNILNRKIDQRLCFRFSDSAVPPLLKAKISGSIHHQRLYRLVCVRTGRELCRPFFRRRGSGN